MRPDPFSAPHLPRQLSFAATLQMLANGWLVGAILPPTAETRGNLAMLRMTSGSSHIVADRPDRIEPRAIKRRPSTHDLLRLPRAAAIAALLAAHVV